jgi:hypothetical protein
MELVVFMVHRGEFGMKTAAKNNGMVYHSSWKILQNSVVFVSQDQVSCDLAGESAILNLKAGLSELRKESKSG